MDDGIAAAESVPALAAAPEPATATTGEAAAPRCRKIDGTGTVDQITARALAALN